MLDKFGAALKTRGWKDKRVTNLGEELRAQQKLADKEGWSEADLKVRRDKLLRKYEVPKELHIEINKQTNIEAGRADKTQQDTKFDKKGKAVTRVNK